MHVQPEPGHEPVQTHWVFWLLSSTQQWALSGQQQALTAGQQAGPLGELQHVWPLWQELLEQLWAYTTERRAKAIRMMEVRMFKELSKRQRNELSEAKKKTWRVSQTTADMHRNDYIIRLHKPNGANVPLGEREVSFSFFLHFLISETLPRPSCTTCDATTQRQARALSTEDSGVGKSEEKKKEKGNQVLPLIPRSHLPNEASGNKLKPYLL